jgi:hypothetical protein
MGGPGMGGPGMSSPGMTSMPGRENPTGSSKAPGSGSEASPGMSKGTQMSSPQSVSQHLAQNTELSSKLQGLLPAGTNLQTAAGGFKNLGQFVAAVHVSHNLGIPFDQLKAKMEAGQSLGKAIQDLKPAVNAKDEARKAEKQAKEDVKGNNS